MVLGKLASHMQKTETGPFPFILYKNYLQMDLRLKHKTQNHKNLRRKSMQYHSGYRHGQSLYDQKQLQQKPKLTNEI